MSYTAPGQNCPGCGSFPAAYRPQGHHFPPGRLLGNRYYVGRVLGEGGFGITYLGFDTKLERRVAIKEYYPRTLVHRDVASSMNVVCFTGSAQNFERGREQFLSEARTLSRLDSIPQIVRVLDFFPENNSAYIVMEFLEGKTLKDIMQERGRMLLPELLAMLEPVLGGMQSMHNAGIIHRDITPDNLMLMNHTGQVKLMDFGCAREVSPGRAMTVVLKPGFAPIEQSAGQEQGPWTDVYGMCATIYYCLTGVIPPDANQRLLYDSLVPPSYYGVQISPAQEQALLKGLAVHAVDRWYSVSDLYYALFVPNESYTEPVKPAKGKRNIRHGRGAVKAQRIEQAQQHEHVLQHEQVQHAVPVQGADSFGYTEYAYGPAKGETEYIQFSCVYPEDRSNLTPGHGEIPSAMPADVPVMKQRKPFPVITVLVVAICLILLGCVIAVISAFPHEHSYGEWTVVREPTCTQNGLQEQRCSCGKTIQEEIPMHRKAIIPAVEATCLEYGKTEGIYCADCGMVFQRQRKVLPLGHHWSDWHIITPASCTHRGLKTCTCFRCGDVSKTTIDYAEHSYRNGRCTVCGQAEP